MKKAKKKIREWGLIELFETSVVGIGAYPDAHMSFNGFSLVKSLSDSYEDDSETNTNLNKEVNEMTEQEETQTQTVEDTEKQVEEVQEEAEEVVESEEEKSEEEATEEKSFNLSDIQDIVSKAVKEALKGSETQRGLVEKQKDIEEELKEKQLGELVLMMSK